MESKDTQVLVAIRSFIEEGRNFLPVREIAVRAAVDKGTVVEATYRLEASGELVVKRSKVKGHATEYYLPSRTDSVQSFHTDLVQTSRTRELRTSRNLEGLEENRRDSKTFVYGVEPSTTSGPTLRSAGYAPAPTWTARTPRERIAKRLHEQYPDQEPWSVSEDHFAPWTKRRLCAEILAVGRELNLNDEAAAYVAAIVA